MILNYKLKPYPIMSCCLCFEPYELGSNPPHQCIPCGHVMCLPCLNNWFKTKSYQTCPICRSEVNKTILDQETVSQICLGLFHQEKTDSPTSPDLFSLSDIFPTEKDELIYDQCHYAFYVLDNSLSMEFYYDGCIYQQNDNKKINEHRFVSRWKEATHKLIQIVRYNLKRRIPASYYLLNPQKKNRWIDGLDYLTVDVIPESQHETAIRQVETLLCVSKVIRGSTPLEKITRRFAETLQEKANSISIPICYNIITDGEPNNKMLFTDEITRITKRYNIFLVINLCTNNPKTVEYYNQLDVTIGSKVSGLDVIDDYRAEKKEVWSAGNRCFHYSLPIHICRMAGCYSVLADWMDEIQLEPHYINKLVREITCVYTDLTVDHYRRSRTSFLSLVEKVNRKAQMNWDLDTNSMIPLLSPMWLELLIIQKICLDYLYRYWKNFLKVLIPLILILVVILTDFGINFLTIY